jgi:hypothetical protein
MSFYNLVCTAVANNSILENAYQYVSTSLLASSEEAGAILEYFVNEVIPVLRPIMHNSTQITQLYVIAPYSPDVFALQSFPAGTHPGTTTGEALPRFVAWQFRSLRQRRDIRNGYKRIGIVGEGAQSGGVPIAGALTNLNAFAAKISAQFTVTGSFGSYGVSPVVVKRIKYESSPGKFSYRLPQGTDPLEYYEATNWLYHNMSTQNSRKIGVGS